MFQNLLASFRNSSGNALVISFITVTIMTLSVVSLATLIGNSRTGDLERSVSSYFAVDGLAENAMFDISAHAQGYEISRGATNYNRFRFGNGGRTEWWLANRAEIVDGSVYELGNPGDYMKHPAAGHGTSADGEWNTISAGQNDTINLFVDNTSCSQSSNPCE